MPLESRLLKLWPHSGVNFQLESALSGSIGELSGLQINCGTRTDLSILSKPVALSLTTVLHHVMICGT